MPIPDAIQPNTGAPAETPGLGLRRILSDLLGLIAMAALLLAIWPGVIEYITPGFHWSKIGGSLPVRFAAFFTFLVAFAIRVRVNPGIQPTRAALAWAQFATDTGGTLFQKRREPTLMGWEGGATVRWESHGAAFVLSGYTDSSRKNHTRIQTQARLSQPLRFYALPRSFLTEAFASPQVWNLVLSGQKAEDIRRGTAGTDDSAAAQMSFMAEKEVRTGDPLIDAAVLLKSDNPSVAREFFSDAGVSHWLRELTARRKGWQLSLVVKRLPDLYELTLAIPGVLSDPKDLDVARQIMEAAMGRLADRGVLGTDRRAAGGA